jgi:hypothetical protein
MSSAKRGELDRHRRSRLPSPSAAKSAVTKGADSRKRLPRDDFVADAPFGGDKVQPARPRPGCPARPRLCKARPRDRRYGHRPQGIPPSRRGGAAQTARAAGEVQAAKSVATGAATLRVKVSVAKRSVVRSRLISSALGIVFQLRHHRAPAVVEAHVLVRLAGIGVPVPGNGGIGRPAPPASTVRIAVMKGSGAGFQPSV